MALTLARKKTRYLLARAAVWYAMVEDDEDNLMEVKDANAETFHNYNLVQQRMEYYIGELEAVGGIMTVSPITR